MSRACTVLVVGMEPSVDCAASPHACTLELLTIAANSALPQVYSDQPSMGQIRRCNLLYRRHLACIGNTIKAGGIPARPDGTDTFPARVTKYHQWPRGAYLHPQISRISAMIICRCITGHGCHGIPPQNKRWEASFCESACCRMSSPWYRGTGIGIPRSLPIHEFRYRYHRYRRYRIPPDPPRPARQSAARDFDDPTRGIYFSAPIAHSTMMLPHQAMRSAFHRHDLPIFGIMVQTA